MKHLLLAAAIGALTLGCSSSPEPVSAPAPTLASLGHQGMDPVSGNAPEQLVVFFHGYTQSGTAMKPLADAISSRLPNAAFVYNNGPLTQGRGYSWYDFRGENSASTKKAALDNAAALVSSLSNTYDVPTSKIVTVGFSQGGGVAAQAATCVSPATAAIVSLAGVIETVCDKTGDVSPEILIVWNEGDPTVGRDRIDAGITALKEAGYAPSFDIVAGDTHWPSQTGLDHAVDFIVAQLSD